MKNIYKNGSDYFKMLKPVGSCTLQGYEHYALWIRMKRYKFLWFVIFVRYGQPKFYLDTQGFILLKGKKMSIKCSRCNKDLTGHAKFCVSCANDFDISPLEAAAPDLLAACKNVRETIDICANRGMSIDRTLCALGQALRQTDAAIAKAEPETG